LNHYKLYGKYEGRLPNKNVFETDYYLNYKDLGKNNIKNLDQALEHYIEWGD
jgi:hypothetical protein